MYTQPLPPCAASSAGNRKGLNPRTLMSSSSRLHDTASMQNPGVCRSLPYSCSIPLSMIRSTSDFGNGPSALTMMADCCGRCLRAAVAKLTGWRTLHFASTGTEAMGTAKVQHRHCLCTVRAASDVSKLQNADRMLDAACCMTEVQQNAGTTITLLMIKTVRLTPTIPHAMRSDTTVAMVQIMPAPAPVAPCRLCHES
jgi:hypothetical protein